MAAKEQLLTLLESNKGVYFSGEEIAAALEVSRAAIWKAVKALQSEGYEIDAVTNKGYCLSPRSDVLSPQGIKKYLEPVCAGLQISLVPTASSTNTLAREKAEAGAPEGLAILAAEQEAGRGRLGRSFYSPRGTGLYMSLVLRPARYSPRQAASLTTIAAVAVCEAIEAVSGEAAQIKWVNDIYMRGKKVCGILTEAAFGLESGLLDYAVLGVGINVYRPAGGFPAELEPIVDAVFPSARDDMKNRLAAAFFNRFMAYYSTGGRAEYVEQYRARSLAIGKQVTVLSANGSQPALVLGIDDDCQLLVRYADGKQARLSSGEISIRL